MTFEHFEEINRVLPVIDEGDPSPSEADCREANRLEDALHVKDPRVQLMSTDDGVRVLWAGVAR